MTKDEFNDVLIKHRNEYYGSVVQAYVKAAIDVPIVYLYASIDQSRDKTLNNPFEVKLFWDEGGYGELLKLDLREDLLEKFKDDPEHYRVDIKTTVKAMRDFASELDQILEKIGEREV